MSRMRAINMNQPSVHNRRDFLKTAGAVTLSALGASAPKAWAVHGPRQTAQVVPTADTMIVLWMAGGMAHTETFDPKPHTPYEPGLDAARIASTFPSAPTVVDGIRFSEGLEQIGSVMDRGTLIRTHTAADLGFILHSRHQYHWHTGYLPPQTVAAPHLGAWVAHALGPRHPAVPAFIDIGQSYEGNGEAEELKAFQTAGILGSEYGPFRIPDPRQALEAVRPPAGMSLRRFRQRYESYRRMVKAGPLYQEASDYQRESLLRSLDNAYRLLDSPAAAAFDLEREPRASYEAYDTGRFGLGCLLARRLTEAGARFIEVTTEYVPFLGWDTHDNGHTRTVELKRQIDRPIAQLVRDLEERGLLERTLIVLATEFSRSVLVEGKIDAPVRDQVEQPSEIHDKMYYGMHRHFTGAGSVLLFGGGMKKGYAYGETSEEPPCTSLTRPVTVMDLHATLYRAMGILPEYHVNVEGRPFYVTEDGYGVALRDLFA